MGLEKSIDEKIADAEKRWTQDLPPKEEALQIAVSTLKEKIERERGSLGQFRLESANKAAKERLEQLEGALTVLTGMLNEPNG